MKSNSFQKFWKKITFNYFNKNNEVKNVIISEQKKHTQDLIAKITILGLSSLSLIVLCLLIGFVVCQTFNNMSFLNWLKMLGSRKWSPNDNSFGVIAFVVATFWVALISMLIAVPLSLLTSLFICEFLPRRLKKISLTLVELLSGIPSVVFGAFGLMTIGPIFVKMGAPTKENMMTASFILSMMALPTIISLSVNAINNVPKSYRYASLALGISRTHTSFKVIFKAALPKIIGAVIFGFGRVIGETMAVVMVAGNSSLVPSFKDGPLGFIFSSVSTLAGVIGLEISEAVSSQQVSALYGIGLFLFIIVSIINVVVLVIYKRTEKKLKGHRKPRNYHLKTSKLSNHQITSSIHEKSIKNRQWKQLKDYVRIFFMGASCFITMGLIVWIIGDIIINGIFNTSGTAGSRVFNFNFIALFQTTGDEGYLSIVTMTCLLVLTAITIAMPLGIIGAIYLHEYAKDNKFGNMLRFFLNTLASTPSIIFGMFGLSLFIVSLGMSFSAITAGLTLTIVVLPLIIRAVEDTLKSVPIEYREVSLALGASKYETIRKVVIPNAIGGIVTSMILSMGRIIGESAPVYLTLGSTVEFPDKGFLSSGQTLTTHIFLIKESNDPNKLGMMHQTALITVVLIFILNFLAKHFEKSLTTGVSVKTKCSMEIIKEKIIAMKNKHQSKNQLKNEVKKVIDKIKNRVKKPKPMLPIVIEQPLITPDSDIVKNKLPTKKKKDILLESYVFKIKNLNFFYNNGQKQALFNINLNIIRNQVTAFIGPSGCGKSTLLRTLNRMNDLIDGVKINGEVIFNNQNIYENKKNIILLRTKVGMVFQKPNPFPISIYENVAYGPRNQGIKNKKILNQIVKDSLKKAALWDEVANNLYDSALSLSGGQQQRLCIARAIALKPEVLLMDEPTSALDPIAASKIEDLINDLKNDFTIIIVTHSMQQAARISNRTVFFLNGLVVEYNDTKKIFSRPEDKRTEDYINGRFG